MSDSLQEALAQCEREPIHVPGSIQPHGLLFALEEPGFDVLQASVNAAELLSLPLEGVLGKPLSEFVGPDRVAQLERAFQDGVPAETPLYIGSWVLGAESINFNAVGHRRDGLLILELERADHVGDVSFANLYPLVRNSLAHLENARTWVALCEASAREVRALTGFDRVMIYRFDEEWTGTVVAEVLAEGMEPYLEQRFPAADIPKQARELYLLNRIRLIATVDYQPVPVLPVLNPRTGRPLDMSMGLLRSVSPVHLEYLRNMEVGASMSISIVQDGRLWGLIACHHRSARYLPFEVRTACEYLGQVLSLQLRAAEEREQTEKRLQLRPAQTRLLAFMAEAKTVASGLVQGQADLLGLTAAGGAAVIDDDGCTTIGNTPSRQQINRLVQWLHEREMGSATGNGILALTSLQKEFPEAAAYQDVAAGILAVSTSEVGRHFLIWFRPEVLQTIKWSGDPNKSVSPSDGKIHPRRSFAIWRETVAGHSLPWRPEEVEAAAELRRDIISIVLRQAEERAQLSDELERTNKELEAFSYSVSHDLRAPFRHITGLARLLEKRAGPQLDETSLRYLHGMSEAAFKAGTLVDGLLEFSQMGRSELRWTRIDMNQLVAEVRRDLETETEGRQIRWEVGDLPVAQGDLVMLRLVWQNLLSNAVKYTSKQPAAVIEISATQARGETTYVVRDNGAGFDMRHVGKLFGVFERLHRAEEFEGTGIGLANVRRVVVRHGGRTWAEGETDKGAAFYFTLPIPTLRPKQPNQAEKSNG